MTDAILKADKREVTGRKVKNLRKDGLLPANIFGKKIKSQSIQIDQAEFQKIFKEVGETGLVELQIGNDKRPVLISNLQVDPISGLPIHADLYQVDLKEKVTAQVPVELTGESPAEKQGLGTVVQQLDEVEVEALPADLPDHFTVDLTKLEKVDDAMFVKDLDVDTKKVEIKDDPEQIVVKVEGLREEEPEEVITPAEGEEAPVEGEEKKEENDAPKGERKEDETKN
jgi:large subunit ribosomal protein L25